MKKYALLSIALTATCLSCFAAGTVFPINPKPWETLSHNVKVMQLANLTDNDLKEIMQGQHPELAVEFSAHTHLPVSFYLKGDLVNLAESNDKWGTLEIKQTFYARCLGEELILSSNLTDWKPFLDFITGNVSVALSIQDGQPSIVVGAETNRRP
jgi:hypothetical protein